jgi:pilus assembly protein CpaE
MDNIKILIIGNDEGRKESIRKILIEEGMTVAGEARGGLAGLDRISSCSPDIVLIIGDSDSEDLSVAERVYLHRPGCAVILIEQELDTDTLQMAMKAGIRNVLRWPPERKHLTESIRLAYNMEKMRITAGSGSSNMIWGSKVITVFGTKGGIGKTTIAANLAVKLAQRKMKVALIDLDLQFGDVNVFLDLDSKETIAELVSSKENFDIEAIKHYMTLHSSGIDVLCSPRSPEYAETITPVHVERIINTIRSYYDYIIIDTPPMFNDCTLTAIEVSSQVLFIIALDISTLRNAKISMNLFDSLQQANKVKLVVNREVESVITKGDAEKIMGGKIVSTLPADWKIATAALNKGVPFVVEAHSSRLSNALSELAANVAAN